MFSALTQSTGDNGMQDTEEKAESDSETLEVQKRDESSGTIYYSGSA